MKARSVLLVWMVLQSTACQRVFTQAPENPQSSRLFAGDTPNTPNAPTVSMDVETLRRLMDGSLALDRGIIIPLPNKKAPFSVRLETMSACDLLARQHVY